MREAVTRWMTSDSIALSDEDEWLGMDQAVGAPRTLGSVIHDGDWYLLNIWVGNLLHDADLSPQARVEIGVAIEQWASEAATRSELERLPEAEQWRRLEQQVERCIAQREEMRPPPSTLLS